MAKTPSFILTQFGFTPENIGETLVALDDSTFQMTTDKKYATSFVLNCLFAGQLEAERKLHAGSEPEFLQGRGGDEARRCSQYSGIRNPASAAGAR
jgi:hypothetical protein